MRSPAPTMLFLFAFVIRHGFVSFVIRKLVCKSDGHINDTQSIRGLGARRLMRSQHLPCCFYLHFVIRHALCQKLCKSVARSTRSINMLML